MRHRRSLKWCSSDWIRVGRDWVRLSILELSVLISLKMVEKWVRDGTIFGRGEGMIINRERGHRSRPGKGVLWGKGVLCYWVKHCLITLEYVLLSPYTEYGAHETGLHPTGHNHFIRRLDSSVGRAFDWRSKGHQFDPGSRQLFGFLTRESYFVFVHWTHVSLHFYADRLIFKLISRSFVWRGSDISSNLANLK